jgi:hypothetical protein
MIVVPQNMNLKELNELLLKYIDQVWPEEALYPPSCTCR